MVPFRPADFAEDTGFERFVLGLLGSHRVKSAEPDAFHSIRRGSRSITLHVGPATIGGQSRDDLRNALMPVSFGTAYKVVDLLVEHVVRANGATKDRLHFTDKKKLIRTIRLRCRHSWGAA